MKAKDEFLLVLVLGEYVFEIAKAAGVFATFETAAEAALFGSLCANLFTLLLFLGPLGALEGEADLALVAVDAQDLHFDFLADLDHVLGLLDLLVGDFRDVEQA